MRDLLARYRLLREDHLRYLVKCGVIQPVLRTNADTFFAFADLAAIKQANDELAQGASFRSVVRALLASRQGQLAFDFRLDAAPAKILTLQRAPAARRRCRPPDAAAALKRRPALAEEYFRAGLGARRWRRGEAGAGGRRLSQGAGARSVSRGGAHQPGEHPLQPRRARRGAGALRARDRPRVGFLRGALQPRQHLSRPRTLSARRRPATTKRCGSIRSTPTRTSIWRSRSKRWGCRRRRGRTGARTSSSRRTASGWSWRGNSRSRLNSVDSN